MQSAVIIAAIALAVFLGYKTKINTGFFCIVFAYFIGCFWLDLKPKALIAFWPTNTMFVIISVSLFYNVAAANGTLEKISRSLLYACRKFPGMLPYALFAVAVILSVMGAAYFTVLAFLAPITLLICEESKMDKLTGAVAINCGALAGGDFPTAALGVIFRGLMDSSYEAAPELEAIDSFVTCLKMFGLAVLFSLILITISVLHCLQTATSAKMSSLKTGSIHHRTEADALSHGRDDGSRSGFPAAQAADPRQCGHQAGCRKDRRRLGRIRLRCHCAADEACSAEGDHRSCSLEYYPDDRRSWYADRRCS